MRKKAIIFDLDNTIYPVSSIADKIFKSLFQLIYDNGEYSGDFNEVKLEIMRRPFQMVADEFNFSDRLKSACLNLLSELTYEEKMEPFEDYEIARKLSIRKYLVTTGFSKLQYSKISRLEVENDFEKIFVIDPGNSDLTKKDVFSKILTDDNYQVEEILVVGDDLNAEIKAAKELGIETVLYDPKCEHADMKDQNRISNFRDLQFYIS